MARIRTVKPEFWTDEDLATVTETARLVAIGLLNLADDEGFFNANIRLIECSLFPLTEPSMSIHECLKQLVNIGYLEVKNTADGKSYGHVVNFTKHQKVNRPTASKIKHLFTDNNELTDITEGSLSNHGTFTVGKERKGKEQGKEQGKDQQRATKKFELEIQTSGNNNFLVTDDLVSSLKGFYPALDVEQQLRNIAGHFHARPDELRPRTKITQFIHSWMQNRANQVSQGQSENDDPLGLNDTSWIDDLVFNEDGTVYEKSN